MGRRLPRDPEVGRAVGYVQPKMSGFPNGSEEAVEVYRFPQVAVGVQFIGLTDVFVRVGRGENRHRNQPQLGMLLDLAKDIARIRLRQIKVEEDELRSRGGGIFSLLLQEGQRFIAIHSNFKRDRRLHIAQRLAYQANIAWIIFHDEDYSRLTQLVSSCR